MNVLSAGFLVVLVTERDGDDGSATYQGVDRVPAYPSNNAEETKALDFYVFGDCKDPRTNLIPSLDKATDLLGRLSRSDRKYEVVVCCEGPNSEALITIRPDCVEHLGYDVAAIQSDYWSIVDDFSKRSWAERFRVDLNEHSLFREERLAEQYLREYKHRNEPDSDSPLEVIYMARLLTKKSEADFT